MPSAARFPRGNQGPVRLSFSLIRVIKSERRLRSGTPPRPVGEPPQRGSVPPIKQSEDP